MHVLADQPGHVLDIGVTLRVDLLVEGEVELVDQRLIAAHLGDQAADILRLVLGVLPAVALGEAGGLARAGRIERLAEAPVGQLGLHEAASGVEHAAPVLRPPVEGGGDIGVAGHMRGLGDRPVVEGVFERLRDAFAIDVHRHVALGHVGAEVPVGRVGGAGDHRPQGAAAVEARHVLGDGVGDLRHGVVADHAPALLTGELPHGKDAERALLAAGDQRVDHVGGALRRLDQRHQRLLGAVGVPQAEGGDEGEAVRLVHLAVRPPVAAVHILVDRGRLQGVVDRGVEGAREGGIGLDRQPRELRLPGGDRRGVGGVEVQRPGSCFRGLGVEVGERALFADRREGHGHRQRPRQPVEVGHRDEAAALDRLRIRGSRAGRPEPAVRRGLGLALIERVAARRLAETDGEVELAARRPASRLAHAGDRPVVADAHARPEHLAGIVVDGVAQVDQHVRGLIRGKGVAVQRHARRRRQFRPHSGVGERHRIVAGVRDLGGVAVARAVAGAGPVRLAHLQVHGARDRHQRHVAQVRVPGAGEMRLAEALDRRIAEAVAGGVGVALVEVADPGVGARLHHAEGDHRTGKGVPVRPGSDERIDGAIGRAGFGGRSGRGQERRDRGPQDETPHHALRSFLDGRRP